MVLKRRFSKSILIMFLCTVLFIAMAPIKIFAEDQNDGSQHANLVLFVCFSDEDDLDWLNKPTEGGYEDSYTKGMTNVQRYMAYYDGSQNRSFSSYMSKISGGKYQVKNIFPQYDEETGKVTPFKLTSVTEEQAKVGNYDTQIIEDVKKEINLSNYVNDLDLNNDKTIDNVTIILQGGPYESSATGENTPSLRCHKRLYTTDNWNGVELNANVFNMLSTDTLNNKRAGVITHEYLHSLNYPDLYTSNQNDNPVGNWDIMSSDGRFMNYPLAYLRMHFSGWADVQEIDDLYTKKDNQNGTFSYEVELNTISDTNLNNAVMITSPLNPYEKFVIEARELQGKSSDDIFDGAIPGSGVIVYRVDTTVDGLSNFYGKTGVYVFGPETDSKRGDALLNSSNPRYGNSDLNKTDNAITFSDRTNTGIVLSNVGDIKDGKVSLTVTVPDWSNVDAWHDSEGISGGFVNLVDLDGRQIAIVQSSDWARKATFYEYNGNKWVVANDLPDLYDGLTHLKLVSYENKIFATYINEYGKITISVLNGNKWKKAREIATTENTLDFQVVSNQLYVTYAIENYFQNRTIYTQKIDITDNYEVELVGAPYTVVSGNIGDPRLLEQNGSLVVAYKDNDTIKLKRLNGTSFEEIKDAGTASSHDIITYNQELYFASASKEKLIISKYSADNGEWIEFDSKDVDSISPKLAIAQGNLYVVYGPATDTKNGIFAYEVTKDGLVDEGLAIDSGARGSKFSMVAKGDTLFVGYTSNGNAYIKEKTISNKLLSLTITPPDKVSYLVGEEMDLTGLKVVANYQKNTRELEAGEYIVTGFGTSENGKLIAKNVGDHTATVTLKSDPSITNTFAYTISNVPVTAGITSIKNNNIESSKFVYGDRIDVNVTTSGATGKQMALYYQDGTGNLTQLSDAITISEDKTYHLSYDTSTKKLPVSDDLTIAVRFIDDDSSVIRDSGKISLAKKQLTASITGTLTKKYDGTNTPTSDVKLQLNGVLNNEVSVAGTIAYSDSQVGKQNLTVKDFKVNFINGADSYYTKLNVPTAAGEIVKASISNAENREMTVTNNLEQTYHYDLTQLLPSLSGNQTLGKVTYTLKNISLGDYYNSGAKIESDNLSLPLLAVNSNQEKEIGTITVTVKSTNFNDFDVKIKVLSNNKKIPSGTVAINGTLTYGQSLNDLAISANMIDQTTQTKVAGTIKWVDSNVILDAGKHSVEWIFIPSDNNYATVSGFEEVDVAKKVVKATLAIEGNPTKEYDGTTSLPAQAKIVVSNVEGILENDKVQVGGQIVADYKSANAGEKEINISGVTLLGDKVNNYQLEVATSLTVDMGIIPAKVKVPQNLDVEKLEAGKPLSSITLKGTFIGVNGEVLSGTLTWENPDMTYQAGSYEVSWVFTPASSNYEAIKGTVEITVVKATDPDDDKPAIDDPVENPDDDKPVIDDPVEDPDDDEPVTDIPSQDENDPKVEIVDQNNQTTQNKTESTSKKPTSSVATGDDTNLLVSLELMALTSMMAGCCYVVKRRYLK
ncbi:MAG: YDG domain-containing protein [Thomasclavelia sp.]